MKFSLSQRHLNIPLYFGTPSVCVEAATNSDSDSQYSMTNTETLEKKALEISHLRQLAYNNYSKRLRWRAPPYRPQSDSKVRIISMTRTKMKGMAQRCTEYV